MGGGFIVSRNYPPHTLHGRPPRARASLWSIEMQFFVHFFAHLQLCL